MFRFLSLFRRNKDEQLNNNDYDFNEAPVTVIDPQGEVAAQKPTRTDNDFGTQQEHHILPTPSTDTTKDDERMDAIEKELRAMLDDPQHPLADDEQHAEGHLLPPDLDLIKGYKEKRKEDAPGVTHYKNGDKEFWFVNTRHVHTGGINEDPTLRTVKMVIDGNEPAFVITEGHMTNMSDVERQRLLEENRELAAAGGNMPESGYAAFLADQKNILWTGGEPSGPEFFRKMQEHGFSTEDVLAITLLKKIADGNFRVKDAADFGTQYDDIMHNKENSQSVANRLDPLHELDLSSFTFNDFQEWYAKKSLPEGKNFLAVSPGYFVPDTNGNIFEKWMAYSGEERDRALVGLVYEQLKTHRKGVMTYGADHLNSLRPVLDQMFGSPGEYTQLVNDEHTDGAYPEAA